MALDFTATNYVDPTIGVNPKFPPTKKPPGEEVGDVSMSYDSFVVPGAVMSSGEIVAMMFIPDGARIVEATMQWNAMGGTAVLDVGVYDQATGDLLGVGEIFDSTAATAAGLLLMTADATAALNMSKISSATPGFDPVTGGVLIALKFTTAGTSTTAETKLAVYTVRD